MTPIMMPGDDPQATRIRLAIELADEVLADIEPARRDEMEQVAQLEVGDMCALRDVRALAQADGRLSLDASLALYDIEERWSSATLAERYVWMTSVQLLIKNRGAS